MTRAVRDEDSGDVRGVAIPSSIFSSVWQLCSPTAAPPFAPGGSASLPVVRVLLLLAPATSPCSYPAGSDASCASPPKAPTASVSELIVCSSGDWMCMLVRVNALRPGLSGCGQNNRPKTLFENEGGETVWVAFMHMFFETVQSPSACPREGIPGFRKAPHQMSCTNFVRWHCREEATAAAAQGGAECFESVEPNLLM